MDKLQLLDITEKELAAGLSRIGGTVLSKILDVPFYSINKRRKELGIKRSRWTTKIEAAEYIKKYKNDHTAFKNWLAEKALIPTDPQPEVLKVIENNFTKISNNILDKLYQLNISNSQKDVLLIIIKNTGLNREDAEFYINFKTGINKVRCSKILSFLILNKFIIEINNCYKINPHLTEWNNQLNRSNKSLWTRFKNLF